MRITVVENPWNQAAMQISNALMESAKQGRAEQDMKGLLDMVAYQGNVKTGPYSEVEFGKAPGLLSGITKPQQPNVPSFMPKTDFMGQGEQQQPNPFMTGEYQPPSMMPQQPQQLQQAPMPQATVKNVNPAWDDIKRQYTQQYVTELKGKNLSPAAMREALGLMKDNLTGLRQEYDTKQRNSWLETLGGDGDYRTKMIAGIKAGIDPNLMKYALDNGIEIQLKDMGGSLLPIGVDQRNKTLINMLTKEPITAEELQKSMTPGQAQELALREAGLYSGRNGSGGGYSGGGSASSDRYVDTPIGRMTAQQLISAYQKAKGGEVETEDEFGNRTVKRTKGDQQLAKMLEPFVMRVYGQGGQGEQGGEQPSNSGGDVSSKVMAARSRGIPDNQIRAALAQDGMSEQQINAVLGVQPSARNIPALSDNSGLDAVNNNWQF